MSRRMEAGLGCWGGDGAGYEFALARFDEHVASEMQVINCNIVEKCTVRVRDMETTP